jgi:hypothetical protein
MEKTSFDNAAPFAAVVIRLLRGALFDDETRIWNELILYQQPVRDYLVQIGIGLHLDEGNGFAFLTQPEPVEGDMRLPRLVRRMPLTYEVTLLLVVLREYLEEFDVQNTDSSRCFVSHEDLLERVEMLFKVRSDQVKLVTRLDSYVQQAISLGFLKEVRTRSFGGESARIYEVRRIIKAKLDNQKLEDIKEKLEQHAKSI